MPVVTLRDVTAETWEAVVALEVHPEQRSWVAPNHISLLQAHYGLGGDLAFLKLVPLAIHVDDEPVGLAMYNTGPAQDRYMIMRLMIDTRHQGRGYGRAALSQLLARFRAVPQASEVAISIERGNAVAGRLYFSAGFIEVPSDESGEQMFWQGLNRQPEPWESFWNPAASRLAS
ncbi:MAG TPA: GNAT family N-acetyltransferase [Thermomicrobiales bacterium]|jgi:diamine N-acetyltransferase|nr:GNAT family N-acetyltransferase [Thermomicrobiales bacterium]